MWTKPHLVFATISVAAFIANVQCLPPCDSPFRLRFPNLFTHCDCLYNDWSEWEMVAGSLVDVPDSQCPTSQAYSETRQRVPHESNCPTQSETRQICLPDVVDRLIIVLGLGSSGRNLGSITPPPGEPGVPGRPAPPGPPGPPGIVPNFILKPGPRPPPPSPPPTQAVCPSDAGLVCSSITEPRGKRSSDFSAPAEADSSINVKSNSDPHPFNWHEHGKRLRRQTQSPCGNNPNAPQHILFLLDTSGSIGTKSFEEMKDALSKLTLLFCKPIQIAVMTFNHEYKLEFCFNCHDNDLNGRKATSQAIKDIPYRSGWTHTGGAARCACERVLHPSCGVPITADCVNVVFITDGKSNDPTREICDEVKCMHDRLGVNTYAIGINNYNKPELDCIAEKSDFLSIFTFKDFNEFVDALFKLEKKLEEDFLNGDYYACYDESEGLTA